MRQYVWFSPVPGDLISWLMNTKPSRIVLDSNTFMIFTQKNYHVLHIKLFFLWVKRLRWIIKNSKLVYLKQSSDWLSALSNITVNVLHVCLVKGLARKSRSTNFSALGSWKGNINFHHQRSHFTIKSNGGLVYWAQQVYSILKRTQFQMHTE